MILPTDVTGRDPRDVISPVELELTPEIADRVLEGDVATWKTVPSSVGLPIDPSVQGDHSSA